MDRSCEGIYTLSAPGLFFSDSFLHIPSAVLHDFTHFYSSFTLALIMMTSTTSFMSYFLFVFAFLTVLVSASPINLKRDVFVPPITYPKAGTVWKVGEKHNVTW